MTETLKPCPFQKEGETHDVRFVELKPGYGQVGCADCGLWFPSDEMLTKAEAFERWNTRHKQTCEWYYEDYHDEANNIWTTECGERFSWAEYGHPKCCPSCGAEVLDD